MPSHTMPLTKSKRGKIVPDRRRMGTERTTLDPSGDDALETPMKAMPEGKNAERSRKGYETMPMPSEKGVVDHKTSSDGKGRVGKPWPGPKGRK